MIQERINTEKAIAQGGATPDRDTILEEFVEVAASYSQRKGISRQAWRGNRGSRRGADPKRNQTRRSKSEWLTIRKTRGCTGRTRS